MGARSLPARLLTGAVHTNEPTFRAATSRERSATVATLAVAFVAIVALAPFASHPVGASPAAIAAILSAATIMMSVSALISYNWYVATRSGAYAMFACAYGATAVLVLAYLLACARIAPAREANAPRGDLSAALWLLYHFVFLGLIGLALVSQAFFARRERLGEPVGELVRRYVAAVAFGTLFGVLTLLAAGSAPPRLVERDSYAGPIAGPLGVLLLCEVAVVGAGLIRLTRLRRRIDLWLAITLAATAGELTLSVLASARYTVGWYGANVLGAVSLGTLFIAQFGQIAAVFGALARDNRTLTAHAGRDALTGLVNRRGFDEQLERLWQASRAASAPLALVIVDIDYFKQYNDRYGHPGGDEALRLVARCLGAAMRRPADVCARIGGEEFALLLPATDPRGAHLVAETIRASLEERAIPHGGGVGGRLTASFGIASSADVGVESARLLHEWADEALYEAKRLGRNRVFAARRPVTSLAGRVRP